MSENYSSSKRVRKIVPIAPFDLEHFVFEFLLKNKLAGKGHRTHKGYKNNMVYQQQVNSANAEGKGMLNVIILYLT